MGDKYFVVIRVLFFFLIVVFIIEIVLYFKMKSSEESLTFVDSNQETNVTSFFDQSRDDSVYNPSSQSEESTLEPGGLPLELTTDFDPSVNSAVFDVLTADIEAEALDIKVVWPQTWEGKEFRSKIGCDEISYSSGGEKKKINKTEFFAEIADIFSKRNSDNKSGKTSEPVLFQGICTDPNCQEINKDCFLILP